MLTYVSYTVLFFNVSYKYNIKSLTTKIDNNEWIEGLSKNISIARRDQNWTSHAIADGLVQYGFLKIIIQKDENKWFITEKGVSNLDNTEEWTTYTTNQNLVDNWVESLSIDSKNNKWSGQVEEDLDDYQLNHF
jgi:hypothetical protein